MPVLYMTDSAREDSSEMDQRIAGYIGRCSKPYYDQDMKEERNFSVFVQLSELRKGLFSWYPFREGASILEIDAGFGAITGALCERGGTVTVTERSSLRAESLAKRWDMMENLEIYAGDWEQICFQEKFDYIVMSGTLERAGMGKPDAEAYARCLDQACSLLKEDGRLLLTAENRLGMRYLCGASESFTGKKFAGLNQYPDGTEGYTFTRGELEEHIRNSPCSRYKCYYPMPDHLFTKYIFTEEAMPEEAIAEQLPFYYRNTDTQIVSQAKICRDVIRNGLLGGLADSYLLECCRQGDFVQTRQAECWKDVPGKEFKSLLFGSKALRPEAHKETIQRNLARLESEEEKLANYLVSDKMKKIWGVELRLLDAAAGICERHHLKFFMLHGTLLGAVRHRGFIPWDDDLDIGMPREDYDRFLAAAEKELPEPLSVQTMWTEEDCFFGSYCRLRDGSTTGIQVRELGHKGNQGIWIDILPLDNCVQDPERYRYKERRIKHYNRLLQAKIYGSQENCFGGLSRGMSLFYRFMAAFFSHNRLCDRLDQAIRLYTDQETGDLAIFSGYTNHRVLNRKDFWDTVLLEFAGRNLPAPKGYENYLFMIMGKDYMRFPPESERKPKHRGIFDPDKPYQVYTRHLNGMFQDLKGRKIIIFGAGMMFDDYMQKWGGRYRPAFIVDNDENKWGRMRRGILIQPPQSILEVPGEKRRLIICSYYYKEIQKQLEEMGISDYQVYIQDIEWILKAEE